MSLTLAWLENPYAFVFFGLSADLGFVLNDACVQKIQYLGMATGQLTFLRSLFTTMICFIYMYIKKPDKLQFDHPKMHMIWARSFIGMLNIICGYQAFAYISLSEGITILQLRPFMIGFLCLIFLGEAFTARQIVACFVSALAVILVIQPEHLWNVVESTSDTHPHRTLGFVLSFAGAALQATSTMILRKVGPDVDSTFLLLTFAIAGMVLSLMYGTSILNVLFRVTSRWSVLFREQIVWFTVETFSLLAANTAGCFVAQLAYVEAIKRAEGIKVAGVSYSQIVWSVIVQSLWVWVVPTVGAIVGMLIIIVAGVWALLGKAPDLENDLKEDIQLRRVEEQQLLPDREG